MLRAGSRRRRANRWRSKSCKVFVTIASAARSLLPGGAKNAKVVIHSAAHPAIGIVPPSCSAESQVRRALTATAHAEYPRDKRAHVHQSHTGNNALSASDRACQAQD